MENWLINVNNLNSDHKRNVIDYLNKKYNSFFEGGATFYGVCNEQARWFGLGEVLPSNAIIINYDQFMEMIEPKTSKPEQIIGYKLKAKFDIPKFHQSLTVIVDSDWVLYCVPNLSKYGWHFAKSSIVEIRIKDAEVLDIWFEPVYGVKYKEGDWVYVEGSTGSKSLPLKEKGDITQITKIDDFNKTFNHRRNGRDCNNTSLIYIKRLATPEEIEKVKLKIEIKGYKPEFKKDEVSFGCQHFSKADLISYQKLLNRENDAKIEIGGVDITNEIISYLLSNI